MFIRMPALGVTGSLGMLAVFGLLLFLQNGCERHTSLADGASLSHRFVDPALRQGATVHPTDIVVRRGVPDAPAWSTRPIPEVTIEDDTRRVLMAHPRTRLAARQALEPSAAGTARIELPLPRALESWDSFVVSATVHVGDAAVVLPLSRWDDVSRESSPIVLELEHPSLVGADDAEITVWAFRIVGRETGYQTPPVGVAPGSRLVFATGAQERSLGSSELLFRVSACPAGGACEVIFSQRGRFDTPASTAWTLHEVDLESFGDETLAFRFETVIEGEDPNAASFPVWGNPEIRSPAPRREGPLRVILISLDTLGAGHMGAYGYSRDTTPFLDSFAQQGVLFESFVASATSTGPSHMSIMTSLRPSRHGATKMLRPLIAPVPTLAEWLRSKGFATAASTENAVLSRVRGFGRGFDEYVENKSVNFLNPTGQIETTFAKGRAWLERNRSVPAFLFLHTYQVHAPYRPPPAYASLFEGDSLADTGDMPKARDAYDREIRYVDDQMRALIDWLAEESLLEDTLIVLTSDHGEEFREHGGVGHGSIPYEEVIRVPLLMRGPGVPQGVRVRSVASHLDLVPTIVALLGVPSPEHVQGRSLVPLLGGDGSTWDPLPAYSEAWSLPRPYRAPAIAVRTDRHKLIRVGVRRGNRNQLFDLQADPGERDDIAAREPARARELQGLLEGAAAERQHEEQEDRKEGPNERMQADDADLERKLRALGYIE
jgi:arylsulfatase A-like enzyme